MNEPGWIERERTRCRRPITEAEVAGLEALGSELRRLRWEVGRIHRQELAVLAELSVRQIEQIEQAIRRTRRSTLSRIAAALVELRPSFGDRTLLSRRLARLAGSALAPESEYRDRVERRRKRRYRRRWPTAVRS